MDIRNWLHIPVYIVVVDQQIFQCKNIQLDYLFLDIWNLVHMEMADRDLQKLKFQL